MQTRIESGEIRLACTLGQHLQRFLDPLLVELDEHLDKRLVRTFAGTIAAILRFRHPRCGLLLSQLGAYLTSPLHAPAGTKRLSNLLRSPRWRAEQIADFLWRGAETRLRELEAAGEDALLLWDESVLEKPESTGAHGLCPVRSSQDERLIPQRRRLRKPGLLVLPVAHAADPEPLWLVVSRPGQGREPWYLLTNEPIESASDAWRVVLAYARRWQIEMAFRFTKSELALESPRLWFWENRLKLLQMVSLTYAFLLQLLQPARRSLCDSLLRIACPRTGKRSREAPTPLYRLRIALCALGASLPTPGLPQLKNSG